MKVFKFFAIPVFVYLSSQSVYASSSKSEMLEEARLNKLATIYLDDLHDRQRRYDLDVKKDSEPKKPAQDPNPKKEAPKQVPKQEGPKQTPKAEAPKQAPKQEAPKQTPKAGVPKQNPKAEIPKPPKGWHIPAIGQVVIPDGNFFFSGTATHIGDGYLVSAAHVFSTIIKESFPQRPLAKKQGRVKIDLTKRGAYFAYENKHITYIDLQAIVFDVRYINNMDLYDKGKSVDGWEKYDYVFVLMDTKKMPANMPAIPLIEADTVFSLKGLRAPKMVAYYGYGAAADKTVKGRHHVVHKLTLNAKLQAWDAIYLTVGDSVRPGHTKLAEDDLETILNKKGLDKRFDRESASSQPGDSGGGLILKTSKGLRLIGACATFVTTYGWGGAIYTNGFVSFIQGTLEYGYSGNTELLEIVKKLKK